jgi:DNA-binding NarL/FixJ family response regulator
MTTELLLADNSLLLRQGLRAMLAARPEFSVVAETNEGKEASRYALELLPGLVIMDIQLPGMSGIQATALIKRRAPQVRVLILTACKTADYVREALRAGADGYVLKDASFEELVIAMRSVILGKKYLSPDVSCHLVDGYLNPHAADASATTPLAKLTTRERSVLQLVAEGRTNRVVAEFLSLSPKTVEKHRSSLMRKLGLHSATELALTAIELGLIDRPGVKSRGAVLAAASALAAEATPWLSRPAS